MDLTSNQSILRFTKNIVTNSETFIFIKKLRVVKKMVNDSISKTSKTNPPNQIESFSYLRNKVVTKQKVNSCWMLNEALCGPVVRTSLIRERRGHSIPKYRSPGKEWTYPVFWLRQFHERGAWWSYSPRAAKMTQSKVNTSKKNILLRKWSWYR